MQAMRCLDDLPAPEQLLEHFGARNAAAQLHGDDGRRTAPLFEVDARRVDQVAHLQHRGREPDEKTQRLAGFVVTFHAEVVVETHAARNEIQQCRPHAEWCDRRGRNVHLSAQGEQPAANLERKEVEPVEVGVGAFEKRFEVAGVEAALETPDLDAGVDVAGHLDHDVELRSAHCRHGRARLAIEVRERERIEIGDRESADAEAGQCQQIDTAHTTQTGDADSRAAQPILLRLGDPAEIA